jgi:hypothetical protein
MIQCPKCGVANAQGTKFCSNCGNTFATNQPQITQKNKSNLKIVLIVLGCILGSCVLCGIVGGILNAVKPPQNSVDNKNSTSVSNSSDKSLSNANEDVVLDSSVEFILDLSKEEKLRRFKIIKTFPKFSEVSEAIKNLGFSGCNSYKSNTIRSEPDTDTLTGLLFGCDDYYKKQIGSRKYQVVLLGQSKDSVDTIRFQTFGVFTKEAREQLLKDAELVLAKINKGKIPSEFSKNFYAGKQMGEGNGISNGFCDIQALQSPINGKSSTENDRISLDLVFDKPK